MATDRIILPGDPVPAGRNEASRSRVEDGVTKHWPRVIEEDDRIRSGIHLAQTGLHAISATAQAANVGFWYLLNPLASGILMALRRVEFQSNVQAATAAPTLPRLQLESFTFTGTHTGALVTTFKQRSTFANPVGRLSLASTGLTMTAGAPIYAFFPVVVITAGSGLAPSTADWLPESAGQPILAPGQGLIFRQPDAATATDPRRFVTNIAWEEFTEF